MSDITMKSEDLLVSVYGLSTPAAPSFSSMACSACSFLCNSSPYNRTHFVVYSSERRNSARPSSRRWNSSPSHRRRPVLIGDRGRASPPPLSQPGMQWPEKERVRQRLVVIASVEVRKLGNVQCEAKPNTALYNWIQHQKAKLYSKGQS